MLPRLLPCCSLDLCMYVCMYVCMHVCIFMYVCTYVCMVITYSKSMDEPGKVANPALGQLNRENVFPCPRSRLRILARWVRQPRPASACSSPYSQAESGAYLRDSSRVPRLRPHIYLKRHTPSAQSRVHRVTQLRTDDVHCRESAGTGPVNPKVVPNGCCLGRSPWIN